MKKEKISIVVPCYNEEAVIMSFYDETKRVLSEKMGNVDYEILFIDDGSKDSTLDIIEKLSLSDEKVEYVSFSRNFGKESAMYAGFQYAEGDYIVLMDADLQHPPKYIPEMYEKMQTGQYDMIATRRKHRGEESRMRTIGSKMFYGLINRISGIDMGNNAMDYRMFNKKAKEAILSMTEYNRFSKGIFEWIGFRTYWLDIEIDKRIGGESKWSISKLIAYSIEGCVAFSTVPLALSSIFGILFCGLAFLLIMIMVINACFYGVTGTGYATIICVMLLMGGIQLFCIGILGQYLAKDYLENKKRPAFLIQRTSKKEKE